MNAGKVVIALAAGLAAGAIIGVLIAPDKGSKTRDKILKKSHDAVDDIKDKLDDLLNGLAAKFQTAKEEVNGLMYEKGKKVVDNGRDAIKYKG